ncbi:hypothetical protein GLOIN_2v1869616 [Rhizophagus clarus]|uniref:SAM domain-containing protein n=1 Tax=Rhizophagus clarus TaxID=94130 RepID=A0A8H3R0H7_9GLOM|nr:hypothetical protein GLOIN_2v1869616 [Rhizophagus clarus]
MSETSTPYTPASTTVAGNETVSLADEIKKYKTKELIDSLRKEEDLELSEKVFEILEKQEVNGRDFLKTTKEEFLSYGMPGGPAKRLADFAKECKEKKLRAFSTYRSLKEVLAKYGIGSDGTETIPLFSPQTHEVQDSNKHFEHCIENILFRMKNYGSLVLDSLESMRNEYVSTILHTALHIAGDVVSKEFSMRPEYEIIGDESCGRVDYAIKEAENLICVTEDKCTKQVLSIMSNAQSIDSLREVNARLLVEISELRKKFAEVEAENAKLKQIIEENARRDARVEELEQKNMELEHRLAIVEQGSSVVDDQLHKEAISKRFVEQTVSDVDLSSSVTDQRNNDDAKTSEEKEMDAFLVEVNKKSIGDKIRESRREKNVLDKMIAKDSSSVTSDLTHCEEDLSMTSVEPVTLSEQVVKESIPACKSVTSGNKSSAGTSPVKSFMVKTSENIDTECQKIPYNQKVEQDLRRELSSCTKDDDGKINKAFDIQIPELSLEAILTGSSEVTAQNIVDLFRVAMKLRRKEILCWYCYYKAYEDRVRDVKSKNGVDDKSARTLVYSEIKPLLPDITDVNLRKITFRAKKIYILFDGIGLNRIQIISCSASAISNLSDNQIQDIINDFPQKATNTDKYSVPNWNGHVTSKTNKTEIQADPLGRKIEIVA